jgi:hypothetical protein
MVSIIDLCPKCMANDPQIQRTSGCPYCGWTDEKYENDMFKLPIGTILKDRFVIGRVLTEGGTAITYMAFDNDTGKQCCIKEFYPKFYAHRETKDGKINVRPNPGKDVDFRIDRQKFIEEGKQNAGKDTRFSVDDMFSTNNTAYVLMSADDKLWRTL